MLILRYYLGKSNGRKNASLKLYNAELGNLKERNKDTQNSYDYLKQKAEILVKVQATQKAKVDELNKALENAKKAQETYNQKVAILKSKNDL